MGIRCIETDKAPAAVGPYSQAVQAGDFLYVSGQIPLDPATGKLVGDTVDEQVSQILTNLKTVLNAGGCEFRNVVETTIFLTDMADFQTVNTLYADAMGDHKPARATIAVAGLPLGARVEIKMIAYMK